MNVDSGNVSFFVDPTPTDNSEFNMQNYTTAAGGPTVNVGRYGTAVSGSPADNLGHYDLLSLFLHEMEHGLGFSQYSDRWGNVVSGSTMTVSTSVSGLASDLLIPLDGSHIDGYADGGDWDYTAIALPGWPSRTRALLSEADVLGVGAIAGATADQLNTNPSLTTVPLPGAFMLMLAGLPMLMGVARRGRNRS
jgi:hypothetical protein